jgi:hypothetical protein
MVSPSHQKILPFSPYNEAVSVDEHTYSRANIFGAMEGKTASRCHHHAHYTRNTPMCQCIGRNSIACHLSIKNTRWKSLAPPVRYKLSCFRFTTAVYGHVNALPLLSLLVTKSPVITRSETNQHTTNAEPCPSCLCHAAKFQSREGWSSALQQGHRCNRQLCFYDRSGERRMTKRGSRPCAEGGDLCMSQFGLGELRG